MKNEMATIESFDVKVERKERRRDIRCKNCRYSVVDEFHGRICKCQEKLQEAGVDDFLYPYEVRSCKYKEEPDSWLY
jgi:transposase-like protein